MVGVTDFLLELLCEEIPARMQAGARNDLARLFAEELDAIGVTAQAIDVWSTPRRLALVARGLPLETQAVQEELKGPRTNAPPLALEGFLRKVGLPHEQLEDRDGIWFAVVEKPGRPMIELLGPIIERIVRAFPWPKSMRWGEASQSTASLRWVRPLHGIIALLGDNIVPVAVDGVKGGATTIGHRFHHPGPITIGSAHDYAEKLRACHVIVDHEERERLVRDGAVNAATAAGLQLVEDEGLVVENAGLTEWPVPLLGRFDPDFLDVPREVIVLTMRTNQKYFACLDADAMLAPAFVCVANIDANDGGEAIVEGNRRVLAARLADARFFWEQDLKVPLEKQAKRLSGIVFHEKLGTVADKVERVAKLARWLAEEGVVKEADPDQVERAARLAKADLVTGMVGEFPELQGVIGGYLARSQGEPNPIADAIRDHYKPVGQGDEVPTGPVTVAVGLADKLDSLAAFFGEQMLPTGSKDPFALRRAALGVISLIRSNDLKMEIGEVVRQGWGASTAAVGESLIDFHIERLKVALRDEGVRHDLLAASTDWQGKFDGRLDRVERRAKALQKFVEGEEGGDLLTAYRRAANILKKEQWESRHPGLEPGSALSSAPHEGRQMADQVRHDDMEREEAALISALGKVEPQATEAVAAEDFTGAMRGLAQLRLPVDAFFDRVTVNDSDPAKRERRLNLLARLRNAVHLVADFSKIEG